jgi:hypothetical protein
MVTDKRALKILTTMFWSSAGWKRDRTASAEDFAYAKAQGLMFDPVTLTHDEAVSSAIHAAGKVSLKAVSDAFIASLGSRRLDLRSAMASYAVGRHMKAHDKIRRAGDARCGYCGGYDTADADPNILNFERFKWGGVRHDNPQYIAFDLTVFGSVEVSAPTPEDYSILRSIVSAIETMPISARLGDLERALSKLLPSNNAERRTLIGILGYAGIIIDPSRPSFQTKFVPCEDREMTPWGKDDWPYPVQWWTGACGLNRSAVSEWFPEL